VPARGASSNKRRYIVLCRHTAHPETGGARQCALQIKHYRPNTIAGFRTLAMAQGVGFQQLGIVELEKLWIFVIRIRVSAVRCIQWLLERDGRGKASVAARSGAPRSRGHDCGCLPRV
jgi:hypothetical protein